MSADIAIYATDYACRRHAFGRPLVDHEGVGFMLAENLTVESKVFENDFFGYTKVTVETALCDEQGKPVLKKGQKQPVKGASDTEIIPLSEDLNAYMEKNVLPYNPAAYLDRSKDKIGYEVPFTRLFYKFTPPVASAEVYAEIKALEQEEAELMRELFGNA